MTARLPPELLDALRLFARIARALADYLEAEAEAEEAYGVTVEELLKRVFTDSSSLQGLPAHALAALYEAAVRVQAVSTMLQRLEGLSASEKRRVAEELRLVAERVSEALGESQPI